MIHPVNRLVNQAEIGTVDLLERVDGIVDVRKK